jgi:hypothetical protein
MHVMARRMLNGHPQTLSRMRQVSELVDEVEAEGGGEAAPAQSPAIQGTWRLRWSAQVRRHSSAPRIPGSVLQAEPRNVSCSGLQSTAIFSRPSNPA